MTAPIVLIGIPALLLLVVALPGVRIAKESERGVDGGPVASWPFFQQAEELMSDARLQRHTIRYKQFISAAEECQRSSKTGYGQSGKPAMADPPDYRRGYRAARPSNGPSRPIVAQAGRQVYGAHGAAPS